MQEGFKVYVNRRTDRPGAWEVDVRDRACGRRRKKFENEAAARVFAEAVKRQTRTQAGLLEEHTVEAMVRGYMASVESTDVRPITVHHRREMLRALVLHFGEQTEVTEIATEKAAQGFKERRNTQVGQAMLRHEMWAMRQALRWSQSRGWISEVPEIEIPKMPPPRQVWLRSHEIAPFLEACSEAFRPLAEAAIYFGLREGEVCITQAGDFDLSAGVLWVQEKPEFHWKTKNGKARGIPLVGKGRIIAEEIAKKAPHEWAWPNLKGNRRSPGTWFSNSTKRAAGAVGIKRDLVYHDLRRTFGSMMIEAGAPMRAVQQALGHSSITTTEKVYAPISQDFVADAMTKMDAHLAVKRAEHEASQPKPPPRIALVANGS